MKVKVTNKAGGEQFVPAHWLDHPVLGEGFKVVEDKKVKKAAGSKTAAVNKEEGGK